MPVWKSVTQATSSSQVATAVIAVALFEQHYAGQVASQHNPVDPNADAAKQVGTPEESLKFCDQQNRSIPAMATESTSIVQSIFNMPR